MNLGALIDEYRIRTGDVEKPYFSVDDELIAWFNEAEKEAAIRSRLIRRDDSFDLVAGDASPIDLDDALFDIQYAELRAADGTAYELKPSSREIQDFERRGWRSLTDRPSCYIHDDKQLIVNAIPDQAYTLYIEFFATPARPMEGPDDEPGIARVHHVSLIDWVEFRAYSKPDADFMDKGKAQEAERRFTMSFGKRPSADLRRRQNANAPHRNRLHL